MSIHTILPPGASASVAERLERCLASVSECNRRIMNSAGVPTFGIARITSTPSDPLPIALTEPPAVLPSSHDALSVHRFPDDGSVVLIPMARRLGLEAVSRAYDAGLSVTVLAGELAQ